MASKQFRVTRKDGSEHIVPEQAVDGIRRLYAHEGKDLKIEEITSKPAAEPKAAKEKPAAEPKA